MGSRARPLGWVLGAWLALGASVLGASAARAQTPVPEDDTTRRAARDLAKEGIARLAEGKYQEAYDLLQRAYQIVPAPTVAVLRGRALEQLGKMVEAAESYEAAKRTPLDGSSPEAFRSAVADAKRELERLQPELPRLSALVSGVPQDYPGLEVKLDDKPLPKALVGATIPVNPGEHLLMVSVNDTVHDTRRVALAKGQHVKVLLRVDQPEEPKPPPPSPTADSDQGGEENGLFGWASLGLGGVGFATGIIAGIAMLGHKQDLDEACRPLCPASSESELESFRFTRTVSAVGYGVGFLGVGVGAALLLLEPPKPQKNTARRWTPSLGPGWVGATGRF